MQRTNIFRFFTATTISIVATTTLLSAPLVAQESTPSQPGTPAIELVKELENPHIADPIAPEPATGDLVKSIELEPIFDKRERLLSSPDRVGFGAATTGGSNEVVVSNIEEFISAVSLPNNYVLLAPSLAGQTLFLSLIHI